jgi:hypothetical protein
MVNVKDCVPPVTGKTKEVWETLTPVHCAESCVLNARNPSALKKFVRNLKNMLNPPSLDARTPGKKDQ